MSYRWSRLLHVALIYAIAGWLGGAVITAKGGLSGMADTLLAVEAARAALLAAGLSLAISAPLLLLQRRLIAMIGWVVLSALVTCSTVWLYYAIWPPQWEAPTYKIAGMVLKGYWKHLLPLTLLSGLGAGWLSTMPSAADTEAVG